MTLLSSSTEHPFAQYIRIIGKGKNGARNLSFDEAHHAMTLILNNAVEDVQIGAFLMLLRVKEETSIELAGFVQAVKDHLKQTWPETIAIDLDWSSYAGKRKHYPWFLLSAFLLAQNGVKILMHGVTGHTHNRLYTESYLKALGFTICHNAQEIKKEISEKSFSYIPLGALSPTLDRLIHLRNLLGLRSPIHTLTRLINPFNAPYTLQAIFHPAYRNHHQDAAQLLGYKNSCVIKGEGGEFERNPDGVCLCQHIINGEKYNEEWPMIFTVRHPAESEFDIDIFKGEWRGTHHHEYGKQAIIATSAIALRVLEKADNAETAYQLAESIWLNRRKDFL